MAKGACLFYHLLQGFLNYLIFPALVMTGPVLLVYMLVDCYYDRGYTANYVIDSFIPSTDSVNKDNDKSQRVKKVETEPEFYYQRNNEDLTDPNVDNITLAQNGSASNEENGNWKDCNVILIPFVLFAFICFFTCFVLFKYKLCIDEKDIRLEEDEIENKE